MRQRLAARGYVPRGLLVAVVAVFAALGAGVASAGAARTPSCSLLTGDQVARVLGLAIVSSQPAQAESSGETTCFYSTASNREAVIVNYQTDNAAAAYKTAHTQAGEFARPLKGIAPNGAFYDANAEFADTPEVNFLDGSTEVTIDAFAPLKRVETLAHQIAGAL